jgi:integrase
VKKINFTAKQLQKLTPEPKRYSVFDASTRGLAVAVYPTGAKTFFHLRKVEGWPRRTTIGAVEAFTLEQARGKAAELNAALARWRSNGSEGPNPLAPKAPAPTVGAAFDHYVAHHLSVATRNPAAAVRAARWQFGKYLASWQGRRLASVERADVRRLHEEITEAHGGRTANATVQLLRAIYYHATNPDIALWDGANPAARPAKFMHRESSRERVLTTDERPRFFKQLAEEPNRDLRDAVLLALATGARKGTIFRMAWSEIDFDHELWTITAPKGRRGTGSHVLPLAPLAVAVLKARPRESDWVFPGRSGRNLTTLKNPWRRFLKRAQIDGLTFHDLRRTLATTEGNVGATAEVIQKTLGHVGDSAATRIYDRSDRREDVRAAIGAAVDALLADAKTTPKKLLAARNG